MSGFGDILRGLVERVPGAVGAIFADWEGESVGQWARDMADLDIQIFGAQWGVVWNQMQAALRRARLGRAEELFVDAEKCVVLVRHVAEQYYVVLSLGRGTHLATAIRELDRGVVTLRAEM